MEHEVVERRRVEVGGISASYSSIGEGPPVLLLHGGRLGYSADSFDEVSQLLAERSCRAVALDLPGYGYSDNPPDYSASFTLAFVAGFIEKVCSPAHLVGHSSSGGTVVRLALDRPELARSVVIAGTASLLPVTLGQAAAMARELREEGEPLAPTPEETRQSFRPDVFHEEALDPGRVGVLHAMSLGKNLAAASARRGADRSTRHEDRGGRPLWQRLGELSMPVLAIFGDDDKNRAVDRLPMLAERYPAVETHLLKDCRHALHWDAPVEFSDLVASFVRRVEATRPAG